MPISEQISVIPFGQSGRYEELITDRQVKFEVSLSSLLDKKTPKGVIYKREGRGGRKFDYIQGWWIIDQLNALFDFNWDWEVDDQGVGKDHVWVRGKLTVKRFLEDGREIAVRKSSFGGSEIKKYTAGGPRGGDTIDLGDDLKAASTDAFKKAASLLGIAGDIYGQDESSSRNGNVGGIDERKLKALFFRGGEAGMSEEEVKKWCVEDLQINPRKVPFDDLTEGQINKLLPKLIKHVTSSQNP